MEKQIEPDNKISPSGLPGLLVVAFVVFAFSTLFAPGQFFLLTCFLAVTSLLLAIGLHFYFRRLSRRSKTSIFEDCPDRQKTDTKL